MFIDYNHYIESTDWQNVKIRYYKSKLLQKCKVCNSKKFDLHHKTYKRLGKEKLHDLVPLCRTCHKEAHEFHTRKRAKQREMGWINRGLWWSTGRYIKHRGKILSKSKE